MTEKQLMVFYFDDDGVGRIMFNGREHGSDFDSFTDARDWLETMQDAGLYKDYELVKRR